VHLFRRPRTLGDHLVRGVARAFVLGIGLEAVILTMAAMQSEVPDGSAAAWSRIDQPRLQEARLMERYDCFEEGYPESVIPHSAIVRDDTNGRLRVVSSAQGWQVFTTDDATKTLVALCLRPRG
jgi:hypothetical protein